MTKDEALDKALEAFVRAERDGYWSRDTAIAVEAIKQARLASVQEPVAVVSEDKHGPFVEWLGEKSSFYEHNPVGTKFFAAPPAAQRQWVGLTDEERDHIWHVIGNSDAHGDVDGLSGRDVMASIEAKLKEKQA